MANNVPDEAFARAVQQMGVVSYDQLEAAKAAQAESAAKGVLVPLAEILVQQGVMAPATRENIEKKVRAQQQGGIQQFGQFKLLKKLGEGGMGAVYLAEDTNAGRQVALKLLPKKHAGDSEFLSRFRREARAAGQLNHVNIVSAHTVGEEMGHHYLVMEYVEGEPLDKMLKREGSLPCDKALEIVMQVARGLKHAHEHGIIHRDIKPGNIILTPKGVAKILDLGLSKTISGGDEQTFHTQTGVALGTPHYLSPEQARGDKGIDGRTDIYSLGATFYHLVTGMTPFEGSTAAVIMLKHLNEQLTNPQDIVEDLPDSVAHVIIRMMAKEPADRYRDCKELLDDLELVIDGKDPSSQAIDHGKSSVAMARVARPRRPVGPVVRKHAKAQQGPVAPREERIGGRKPAKAADPTIMYVGIGGAVFALGIILFLMTGGKTETPSRDPGDPSRDRKGAPSPLADARGSESKVPSAGRPDAGTPVPDTRPLAVQPAFGNQQSDALAALGTEKRAQDALDALLKFEGLAADDKAGRIQRLEAFAKDYGATMVGVRARKMLDELRHEAEAAVANDPERWKNAINLLALVDPKKDAVSGKWEAVDGALRSDATGSHDEHGAARIGIPYRPPTEYDYRIQFTRLSGNDCAAQILSASGRQFLFVAGGFGNTVFGFELIIGKQCDENPTAVRRPACLVNGRRYVLLTQVRSNGVKVYLDGVFLTGYVGGSWQMSVKGEFAIPDSAALGLASWGSPVAFHAVEVLEVTGKGTFTRTSKPAGEVGVAKPDGQPVAPAVAVQPQSAKQEPDTGAVYLSDLQGTEIRGVPGQAQTISVNDVTSAHGFMLHPDRDTKTAHVAYTIGGRFGWLVGSVGVNDSVPDRAEAPLVFKVYGDGKVLWQSRPLQKRAESDAFKVNVTAISKLALSVETAETKWAHAVWIEPRLIPAVDPKLEYEKALAEVYAFLNKNDVKATVARLEQAKADPKLAAMKAALDRDIQCAASMEEIDKAVAAGAALLADKRPFTLKKSDGKETAVGGGTKNTIVGVKDGAVQIEMDLGGG
ncbi:MAG: protein kinase [Planctomycetota bacterium]